MAKKVSVYSPRIKVSKRGVRFVAPRARIGGRAGLNISKSGVNASLRTKRGTLNSRHGCTGKLFLILLLPLIIFGWII